MALSRFARLATAGGGVLGLVTLTFDGAGAISDQQAVGLVVPAIVLFIVGLTALAGVCAIDAACRGFQAGFQVGTSVTWLRSAAGHPWDALPDDLDGPR